MLQREEPIVDELRRDQVVRKRAPRKPPAG